MAAWACGARGVGEERPRRRDAFEAQLGRGNHLPAPRLSGCRRRQRLGAASHAALRRCPPPIRSFWPFERRVLDEASSVAESGCCACHGAVPEPVRLCVCCEVGNRGAPSARQDTSGVRGQPFVAAFSISNQPRAQASRSTRRPLSSAVSERCSLATRGITSPGPSDGPPASGRKIHRDSVATPSGGRRPRCQCPAFGSRAPGATPLCAREPGSLPSLGRRTLRTSASTRRARARLDSTPRPRTEHRL